MAGCFRGEKWLKNLCEDIGWDSWTIIADGGQNVPILNGNIYPDIAAVLSGNQRLFSIVQDVDDHLSHLVVIDQRTRDVARNVQMDLDRFDPEIVEFQF